MIQVISPPSNPNINTIIPTIFLAGGITNCPDWQSEIIQMFEINMGIYDVVIFNPRRKDFPINNPTATELQIRWEYEHLHDAAIIIFWFARGSLNPIVLYELGRWGNSSNRPIVIGCDPEYLRIRDIEIQTKLSRPDLVIHRSLESVANQTKRLIEDTDGLEWVKAKKGGR